MLKEISTRAAVAMQTRKAGQEGASAVEYGLILGLIAVVIVGILITIGGDLNTLFGEASSGLQSATGG